MGRQFLLLFIALAGQYVLVSGQIASVTTVPASYSNGDTIRIDLSLGDIDTPAESVTEIAATLQCVGCTFDLSSASTSLRQSSWFADDSNWSLTSSLSNDSSELALELIRTDQEARSGYGYLCSLDGIIIQIEEYNKRDPMIEWTGISTTTSFRAFVKDKNLYLKGIEVGEQVRIISLAGSIVYAGEWPGSLNTEAISAGLYTVLVSRATGMSQVKWLKR